MNVWNLEGAKNDLHMAKKGVRKFEKSLNDSDFNVEYAHSAFIKRADDVDIKELIDDINEKISSAIAALDNLTRYL